MVLIISGILFEMLPELSKMHKIQQFWQKFGLPVKHLHRCHTYQTCHGRSPSQDLKNVVGNCDLHLIFKLQLIQESPSMV